MTILFFLLGAISASFIPCFAERRQKGRSQLGRSVCTCCDKTIAPMYLIPIAGYFLSRGRCRHCGTPIPKVLVLFEAMGGFVGAVLSHVTTPPIHTLLLLLAVSVMFLLSLDDFAQKSVHDSDFIVLALLLIVDSICFGAHHWLEQILGALTVAFPLFVVRCWWPNALGSGDVIFMAVCGFYLGSAAISQAFCLSIFAAIIYISIILVRHKAHAKTAIALIPFLAFGVALFVIFPELSLPTI